MKRQGRNTRDGGGLRARLGARTLSYVAALALAASMCPGAVAIAYEGSQPASGAAGGELVAGEAERGDVAGSAVSAQAEQSTPVDGGTHIMKTGTYSVTGEVTIGPDGKTGNGIQVERGAKVLLVLEDGAKLTVTGKDADGNGVGRAAILLPEGSTLTVSGAGTLNATGGKAGAGANGSQAGGSQYGVIPHTGNGGDGGAGGGGAGAGIGTNGGAGGKGGGGGAGVWVKKALVNTNAYGNDGNAGSGGSKAAPAGTVIATGSAVVNAKGGICGSGGKRGGRGWYAQDRAFDQGVGAGTSGGGGGGGGGSAADGIGSGGTGGGGGGGGASANIDGEPFGWFADLDDLWGHGGKGGASAWGGGAGEDGDEGASNGGDDTDASKKYAKAGGAGGSCAAPVAVAFYTYKESGAASNPTVNCTSGHNTTRNATPLGSSEAFKALGGLELEVSGATVEYDGQKHGVKVKKKLKASRTMSAQAEGDEADEWPDEGTLDVDGVAVAYSIVYYDEAGEQVVDGDGNPSAPYMPGRYAAVVTLKCDDPVHPDYNGSWVEPITIAKRQVAVPKPDVLTFDCENWETGEGFEQDAFPDPSSPDSAGYYADFEFVEAEKEAGTATISSAWKARAAGGYEACFRLKDPTTCEWADAADGSDTVWVPWSIALQEFDPNSSEITYWGTAYDSDATAVAYTGEPIWVRPWFAPAKATGGRFPEWFTHWGGADRPTDDRASAAVVYLKGEGDREGLVGYHEGADGSLEKVTAEQVYAWMFGVELPDGTHVPVESGQKVWYETGGDGWKMPLAVEGDKPEGAEGYVVARDLSYADRLGVMEVGDYRAYAYFDAGAGFAPTALAEADVKVRIDISRAEVALAQAPLVYDGKAKEPAVLSVTLDGKALRAGEDYDVSYSGNTGAGTATATVTGRGDYAWSAGAEFPIAKAPQAISAAKGVVVKAKAKKSGKKRALAKKFTVDLAKKAKVSAATEVAYAKASNAGGKKIAVSEAGKVTLKKGLAKGTYRVQVRLAAPEGANYKAASSKTITLKVKVK